MESVSRCNEAGEGHLLGWDPRLLGSAGDPGEGLTPVSGSRERERSREEEGPLWGEGLTWSFLWLLWGFPRWLSGKESACQCRRAGLTPWVGKTLWRRKQQPTPVFLPGEAHGQRSLAGYGP